MLRQLQFFRPASQHLHRQHNHIGDGAAHDFDVQRLGPQPRAVTRSARLRSLVLPDEDANVLLVLPRPLQPLELLKHALETRIAADLKPLHGQAFIVFHDAYHYFEARFDIEASAALSESDASPPSAARLAEIQSVVQDTGTDCVFSEPQFNPDLIAALTTDTAITTATLDPLGATLTPGAALYEELLENMAATFTECLAPN